MSSDNDSVSSQSAGSESSTGKSQTHYNDWPNSQGFDVRYEERKPIQLEVTGHIPSYATGVLFRTSVGPRDVYNDSNRRLIARSNHWFDCMSQVHRFQIHAPAQGSDKVKVTYNSRLTSDGLIEKIEKTGQSQVFTFGAKYDPCKSLFSKVSSFFNQELPINKPNEVNNAVTLSINYPGVASSGEALHNAHNSSDIVTLCNKTDVSRLQMLDPNTLEPIGIANQSVLHPSLKGLMAGAHAKSDPKTGDVYNFNLDIAGPNSTYRVFRSSASTGETCILATIKYAPAYLHSIFISENHIILCIWNSHFKVGGISVLFNKSLTESMYHNDSQPATWFVIDKRDPLTEGGKGCVAVYESDPFFAFHTINAFEEPNKDDPNEIDIIADIPVWENMDIVRLFLLDNMMSNNPTAHEWAKNPRGRRTPPVLRRHRLCRVPKIETDAGSTYKSAFTKGKKHPDPTKAVTASSFTSQRVLVEFTGSVEDTFELPTLNFNYVCKPYRYIYGLVFGNGDKSTFADGLVKYDLTTRSKIAWERHGHTPGEAIFVPDPQGTHEDDGILLTVVLDGHNDTSYLLVLDAHDLTELGRANVPGVVGFGFHGLFTKMRVVGGGNDITNTTSSAEKVTVPEVMY